MLRGVPIYDSINYNLVEFHFFILHRINEPGISLNIMLKNHEAGSINFLSKKKPLLYFVDGTSQKHAGPMLWLVQCNKVFLKSSFIL